MIEQAQYNENGSISAIIDGVHYVVPDDPDNRHRAELARWEAEGNVIQPYAPPVLSQEERWAQMKPLTPRQLRLVLIELDVTEQMILDLIEAIEDDKDRQRALTEWNWATEYKRDHWLVEPLRQALLINGEPLTVVEFDTLWEWAANL